MKTTLIKLMLVLLVLLVGLTGQVYAEEALAIEIAATGLYLPNNAYSQDRHYLEQDADLLGRIACLMQDVDILLAELHALPPELAGNPVVTGQAVDELAGLIALALGTNPELLPFRSKLAVQAAQTRQAGAKPDPMVMFNIGNLPLPELEIESTPMTQLVFGWSQQYVSYGKRGLRREIASLNEDVTVLELSQRELEVIGGLTSQYYAVASTQSRLRVLDDNAALLSLLIELAERKYALGRTPQAQVLEAQALLTGIEEQRIQLGSLLSQQRELVYQLLGRPVGFQPDDIRGEITYPLPIEVNLDTADLLARTLAMRPDTQKFEVLSRQQELEVELAHRSYRPDYTVTASYGYRQGKRDFISAGISIPLFTHKSERQDAALQEAYAGLDVINGELLSLENRLATRLTLLAIELDRVVELSSLYRGGLLPQARLALDSSIAGYAANQVDFSDLLRTQQTMLSYELELERLYIEYQAALNELQVLTAGEFDPWPYLVLRADAPAGSTVEVPLSAYAQVTAEEQQQLNELLVDISAATGTGYTVPRIDEGFVERLRLPEQQAPSGPAEEPAATEAAGGPVTGQPENESEFHTPFIPSKGESDDKDE